MSKLTEVKKLLTDPGSQVHWLKLLIGLFVLIGLSFGLAALLNYGKSRLEFDLFTLGLIAYPVVFISALLANLTIVAPVPFAIAIMIAAARDFNPVLVALCGAAGGSIGELSGYYAGRWGKKIAVPDRIPGYRKLESWINRYGVWAIIVIAFQPLIPFDVGGLIAGAARMPLHKFLPALFAGKFPKYILFAYAGLGVIQFLPFWLNP